MTDYAISVNPATGEELARYPFQGSADIESSLQRSADALKVWRVTPMETRVTVLRTLATRLRERCEALAQMMTLEMGKPVVQARAEVNKCAQVCEWYADNGPAVLAAQPTQVENQQAWQEFRPWGLFWR